MTKSKSEQFFARKGEAPPVASNNMLKVVSQNRRERLEEEVSKGVFVSEHEKDKHFIKNDGKTSLGNVLTLKKQASGSFGSNSNGGSFDGTGSGYRGPGGTVRQTPEVYSPLWLNSNLNLPRDRATINAWCRSFFALNPIVQNAISLHSTYPISKLNIKCKDSRVAAFFENMIDEIDLMNICVQVAQEYWTLGEAFIYAELDEGTAKWSRLLIQNPDYITVKRSVVAGEPIISLRPDENLRRIAVGNKPSDLQQRQQLDPSIIEHVRRGENIPLSNFYISHLARKISPYEIRGTGLPVSCFRSLMLWDKIKECKFAQADNLINPLTLVKIGGGPDNYKPTPEDLQQYRNVFEECYDEETEVLTDKGFKKFNEVINFTEKNNSITSCEAKEDIKIACFNKNNEQLEYHKPLRASLYNYSGEMYHYFNEKVDIKVTPNHDMWVSERKHKNKKSYWEEWKKVKAKDLSLNDYVKFRSQIEWEGETLNHVSILGQHVPINLYLEFLGYLLSEGCLYTNNKHQYTIGICQTVDKYYSEMSECFEKFANSINKSYSESIKKSKKENYSDEWNAIISSKELYNFFVNEIGDSNGNVKHNFKQIPEWIKNLNKDHLNVLLQALIKGDGSKFSSKNNVNRYSYYTTSKKLSDDVYEIAYKCGFAPLLSVRKQQKNHKDLYTISWSESEKGLFPKIYKNSRNSQIKEYHKTFDIEQYDGKVWCFTVPTGLFITRRNGKITIQGNSQYDKNFKIFTHDGVTVEPVGFGSAIYDTSNDITQLIKEIYIGLMVPQVVMDGGGDITYQNGGVSLDVLRQRYMQFRNMLSAWLRRKIFAPISKINDFYERVDNQKVLIVPEIEWNHMSLFDANDYINSLSQLLTQEPRKVSLHTLYRSLGLEYEDEVKKIRQENIDIVIQAKESESLQRMNLNELRSLDDVDEIKEIVETGLPGEALPGAGGDMFGGPPGGGGLGGLGGGLGSPPGGGLGGGLGGPSPMGGSKPPV